MGGIKKRIVGEAHPCVKAELQTQNSLQEKGVRQGKGEMENETGTGWGDDPAVSTVRAEGGGLQKPHLIRWSCQVALAALHPERRARPPRCSPPFRGLLGQSARGLSLQSADTTAGERQHSENSLQRGVRAVSMSPGWLLAVPGHPKPAPPCPRATSPAVTSTRAQRMTQSGGKGYRSSIRAPPSPKIPLSTPKLPHHGVTAACPCTSTLGTCGMPGHRRGRAGCSQLPDTA